MLCDLRESKCKHKMRLDRDMDIKDGKHTAELELPLASLCTSEYHLVLKEMHTCVSLGLHTVLKGNRKKRHVVCYGLYSGLGISNVSQVE